MGYKKCPYVRTVVRDEGKIIILRNEDVDNSVRFDLAEGIGFPADRVFRFDSILSKSLLAAWDDKNWAEIESLWNLAKPYT